MIPDACAESALHGAFAVGTGPKMSAPLRLGCACARSCAAGLRGCAAVGRRVFASRVLEGALPRRRAGDVVRATGRASSSTAHGTGDRWFGVQASLFEEQEAQRTARDLARPDGTLLADTRARARACLERRALPRRVGRAKRCTGVHLRASRAATVPDRRAGMTARNRRPSFEILP